MPQYMYKSITGWKIHDAEKDKNQPTHTLLENVEYNQLIKKLNNITNELEREKVYRQEDAKYTQNQIRQLEEQKQKQINQIKQQVSGEVEALKQEIERYKEAYEKQKDLNKNLIQVARERGNKDRKIPKKGESYIIQEKYRQDIKSIEKIEITKNNRTQIQPLEHHNTVWKIKIITPWDCSIEEENVDYLVMTDISKGNLKIGDNLQAYKENPEYIDYQYFQVEEPLIIQRNYYCNVKKGFWEVTLVLNVEPTINQNHRPNKKRECTTSK